MDEIRKKLKRQAIAFTVGGFRPSTDPFESWFGRVSVGAPGEEWPLFEGKPMQALCQINTSNLPFRPSGLEDIEFLTAFINPENLPMDTKNGEGWCIRAYKNLNELVHIEQPKIDSKIKPFPMSYRVITEDYPCWEDVEVDMPDEIADDYYDHFENVSGLKLGGWPTLIQGEIFWAPWNKHPAFPKYVFQIDSEEKSNWAWGHGGVGYFGRGTAEGKSDEWAFSWQCL